MKIAIDQPYFLPYLGYWQLINYVDIFVIYDDVNFIKKGWINRNYILLQNNKYLFTLPVRKLSQNKKIFEIELVNDSYWITNFRKILYHAYNKAPYYKEISKLINDILSFKNDRINKYIFNAINIINDYLKIKTKLILSSEIDKNNNLKKGEKIIDICKLLNCNIYINPIGGTALYSKKQFLNEGIGLFFIKKNNIYYKQYNNSFIDNLSIIDTLMFNHKDNIRSLLDEFSIE